jgi:DNA-binding Lrp family transcriptional regulator
VTVPATGILTSFERALLDRAQAGVPLEPRPWEALARDLGCSEGTVLAALRRLAAGGVLRQVSAIFDARACGYASTLAALRVAPGDLARAAAAVAEHPGVTHCYERDHAWNLWFTLAVSPASALGLTATADLLARRAAASTLRLFPALRVFKIAARFDLGAPEAAGRDGAAPRPLDRPGPPLGAADLAAIRALQRPLPLVPAPFAAAAAAAATTEERLLDRARGLLAAGIMRRFAALLHHRRAGFRANVMAAWSVPPERLEEAGARVAGFRAVTHCYVRATHPDWPYALFGMLHGRTREDCEATAAAIEGAIMPEATVLLWTGREFKKTRLELFTPDETAWEAGARRIA